MSEMPSTHPTGGGSYTPPPPPPPPPPPTGTAPSAGGDRNMMMVLSFLWILALIPLLTKKDDSEVQWHAKNGLCILGAEIITWIALTILGVVLAHIFALLGCGLRRASAQ